MSWRIIYSPEARQDLRDIYGYIAFSLLQPKTARSQTRRIMEEIDSLNDFPMRYRTYPGEPWCSAGLRYFNVGNYLVFYLPKEENHTVSVIRIMYGGRDLDKQL